MENVIAVTGYLVQLKYSREDEKPIKLTLQAGQEAIRQWQQGENILFLKGGAYAASSIKAIIPIQDKAGTFGSWSSDNPRLRRAIEEGQALPVKQANERLQKVLSGGAVLPELTEKI